MDETHKLAAIVAPICWIIGLIGYLVIYFFVPSYKSVGSFSFVLGLATGLLNLGLMVKGSKHMVKETLKEREESFDDDFKPSNKPVTTNMVFFMLRILVLIAIFAMIIVDQFITNKDAPKFNVWFALGGYLSVKIILLIVVLIMKGKVNKE